MSTHRPSLLLVALVIACGDDVEPALTTNPTQPVSSSAPPVTTAEPTDPGDASTTSTTASTASDTSSAGDTSTTSDTSTGPTTPSDDTTTTDAEDSTSTGDADESVNGCDPRTAINLLGQPKVEIQSIALSYDPPCIRVSAGTTVFFFSSFNQHPLAGGVVADGMIYPDAGSPIEPTSFGTEASFVLPEPGTYGYYCEFHALSGMNGAILVE